VGIAVGYMGTKRYLAEAVSAALERCKDGIILDAFSGMCSVGEAASLSRNVWNNDTQVFASEVAKAFFTSSTPPLSIAQLVVSTFESFNANKEQLKEIYGGPLAVEVESLKSSDYQVLAKQHAEHLHAGNSDALAEKRLELASNPQTMPYQLATISFSAGYFGVLQAIEIDSVRFALDVARSSGAINIDQHRWALIALCCACSKIATTTGHFAQFLKPNSENIVRFKSQRKKSFWDVWLECASELTPIGNKSWRRRNKVFNKDSLFLLSDLTKSKIKPAVIYADPPYTADHYSRYYHVWDTLILYDYPEVNGIGRYRQDRFVTPFSVKSQVLQAMSDLVERSRNLNADLVLSYPDNGLLCLAGGDPVDVLKKHYRHVEVSRCLDYRHSTMGGSTGQSKSDVKEIIYLARIK